MLKTSSTAEFASAIGDCASGRVWIDRHCLDSLSGDSGDGLRHPAFTRRETQVLAGILRGRSNREIARSLAISEAAAKAVVQRLFSKLKVRTRVQLAAAVLRKGL